MNDKSMEPTDKYRAHFAQLDEDEKADLYIESRSLEIADSLIAGEKVNEMWDYDDITGEVIFCHDGMTETHERLTRAMAYNPPLTSEFYRAAISLGQLIREAAVILGERIARDEMAAPDFGFDAPDNYQSPVA